jgi:nucleotide-binding universal stress UspA family protein
MENQNLSDLNIKRIAGSIAFSPKAATLISKTIKLSSLLNAQPFFIHVGEKTAETEEKMEQLFGELNFKSSDYKIIWKQGDPVNEVVDFCNEFEIDLIIAGALNKENILKFYFGSVARGISRKANCSVLMLIDKEKKHIPFDKIVVEANDSNNSFAVRLANLFAINLNSKRLILVNESHNPAMALSMADSAPAEEVKNIRKAIKEEQKQEVESLSLECIQDNLKIITRTIEGKHGFAISKYAREVDADLLVVNSPDRQMRFLDRLFTHDIEYILADLPCNLLIAKQREL